MDVASQGFDTVYQKWLLMDAFCKGLSAIWSEEKDKHFLQRAAKAAGKDGQIEKLSFKDFGVYQVSDSGFTVSQIEKTLKENGVKDFHLAKTDAGKYVMLVPKNLEARANQALSMAQAPSQENFYMLKMNSQEFAETVQEQMKDAGITQFAVKQDGDKCFIAVNKMMEHAFDKIVCEAQRAPTKIHYNDFVKNNMGNKDVLQISGLSQKEYRAMKDCLCGSAIGYTSRDDGNTHTILAAKSPDRVREAFCIAKIRTAGKMQDSTKEAVEKMIKRGKYPQDPDKTKADLQQEGLQKLCKIVTDKENEHTPQEVCEAMGLDASKAVDYKLAEKFLQDLNGRDKKEFARLHDETFKDFKPKTIEITPNHLPLDEISKMMDEADKEVGREEMNRGSDAPDLTENEAPTKA